MKMSKEVYEIRMLCLKRQLSVMTDLKPGTCRWIQTLHRLCPGTTLENLPVGQGALTENMIVHPQDVSSGGSLQQIVFMVWLKLMSLQERFQNMSKIQIIFLNSLLEEYWVY